jgi:hypothetical protein
MSYLSDLITQDRKGECRGHLNELSSGAHLSNDSPEDRLVGSTDQFSGTEGRIRVDKHLDDAAAGDVATRVPTESIGNSHDCHRSLAVSDGEGRVLVRGSRSPDIGRPTPSVRGHRRPKIGVPPAIDSSHFLPRKSPY